MAHVSHRPLGKRCSDRLVSVEVATVRRLVTYYVLVVIELSSRKVHIGGITPGPDSAFMLQVGRNLTDSVDGFLLGHRFLIMDGDKKFTADFRDLIEHDGTDVIRLPYRSPNLNAHVERFILSIKSECLDRMIFFGEQSLRRAVAELIHHYHGERNHQGLENALIESDEHVGSLDGKVRCRKRLGGMLNYYYREAAQESVRASGRPGDRGSARRSPLAESGRRRFVSAIS